MNWMENLSEEHKKLPLNQLTIPGTHDSGAYQINFKKPITSSNFKYKKLFKLGNFFARFLPFVSKPIEDWTITQNWNIYDQLKHGIRYFDFRISYMENEDEFYITHTFTCEKLADVLYSIKDFMDVYEEEVIVLNFKSDYNHRYDMIPKRNEKVVIMIETILDKLLCIPTADNSFLSLKEMVYNKKRIIIYYEGKLINNHKFLWNRSLLYDPWNDTSKIDVQIGMLEDNFRKMKGGKEYNIISFILTPQKEDVEKDIKKRFLKPCCYEGEGIETYARKIQCYLQLIIRNNVDKVNELSVIKTDYPTDEFIYRILEINKYKDI